MDNLGSTGKRELPPEEDASARRAEVEARHGSACPDLYVGSKLEKELPLKANTWIKIGRNSKAHLMLSDKGISSNHCQMRWDTYQKVVEVRDTSHTGTQLNGEVIRGVQRTVRHGDRVRVRGNGTQYEFVVDLRAILNGTGDPRKGLPAGMVGMRMGGVVSLTSRRDKLRRQVTRLDTQIASLDAKALEREKEYYEILTRRRLRDQDMEEKEKQIMMYLKGAEDLTKHLVDSREEWLERLRVRNVENQEDMAPLLDQTGDLQQKIDKLKMKKAEIERSLHPENYATAVASLEAGSSGGHRGILSPSDPGDPQKGADGEEEYFGNAPGSRTSTQQPQSRGSQQTSHHPRSKRGDESPAAGTPQDPVSDTELFGKSLDEPDAKRPRI